MVINKEPRQIMQHPFRISKCRRLVNTNAIIVCRQNIHCSPPAPLTAVREHDPSPGTWSTSTQQPNMGQNWNILLGCGPIAWCLQSQKYSNKIVTNHENAVFARPGYQQQQQQLLLLTRPRRLRSRSRALMAGGLL